MANILTNMFVNENEQNTTTSARSLPGTAELTAMAEDITKTVLTAISEDLDKYKADMKASMKDTNSLDTLITDIYNVELADIDWLKALDENTLDSMLKSQQSKRSRTKGKVMTMDNYRTMMTAAVAEHLLRLALDKPKSASYNYSDGTLEYSEERLEELKNDQAKLNKEIRNVQSKKSIMKSKDGFTEQDERWLKLLENEQLLVSFRNSAKVQIVDTTKDKLSEMLADVNVHELKAADAKELLERARQLLNG